MSESNRPDKPLPRLPERVRELCPTCFGCVGGECDLCNGYGYVFVSPYDRSKGEQNDDFDDEPDFLPPVRFSVRFG